MRPDSQLYMHVRPPRWLIIAGVLFAVVAAYGQQAPDAPLPEQQLPEQGEQKEDPTAAVILLHGMIDPALEQFIYRKLDRAKSRGVDYVIIEIDSPGGYADASFNLADHFVAIDWAECIAYVPREALSGAAIASMGCDQIVLGPHARFGDAGPIFASLDGTFRYVPEKVQSHMAQHLRALAKAHNRPEALAEALVDSKLKVYLYENQQLGQTHFFSNREIANLDPDQWRRVAEVPESGDGRFLEIVGDRGVELKLAEAVVDSRDQLLERLNVVEPPAVYAPGAIETIIRILNNPFITAILIVGGLIALYIEWSSPGMGVGGTIAALCFGLFFWSRFLGGTAIWLELFLFFAGIGFLLVEFFVLPGFGIAGITGICLVVASLILAGQEFVVPRTPSDRERLALSLTVVVASGFIFLGAAVVITRHFGRIPVLSRLVLNPPPPPTAEHTEVKSKKAELFASLVNIGDTGIADSPLRPAGKVMFGDAYVDVVTDGAFVDAGTDVRVVQVSGNRVVVRPLEKGS